MQQLSLKIKVAVISNRGKFGCPLNTTVPSNQFHTLMALITTNQVLILKKVLMLQREQKGEVVALPYMDAQLAKQRQYTV